MSTKSKEKVRKIVYLLLVVIWMITIFCFSNEKGDNSSGTSKTVTTKVVNILTANTSLNENEKDEIINKIDPVTRKIAHYTIYMLGGILIINYINVACTYKLSENKKILLCIIIGMCYAGTDEFHQLFINGRTGRIVDVYIDTLGVTTGVSIFLLLGKIKSNLIMKKYKK